MLATDSWVHEHVRLEACAQVIDPSVRLYTKDNWFCRALAWVLPLVTFGGMKRRTFLEVYATTIGPLQFYPASWTVAKVERVLPHECRHTQQARQLSFGLHPWAGLPLYAVLYLLLPLPVGLALFRAYYERDAMRYELQWRYQRKLLRREEVCVRATYFGNTVCSGAYGWSLPRCWGVPWFEKVPEQVFKETA